MTSLTVGLGYTAVATGDGGLGLSYTWVDDKERRSYSNGYRDVEGEGAVVLLERLLSDDPFQRSIGLATVNALHHDRARGLADDIGSPLSRSLQLAGHRRRHARLHGGLLSAAGARSSPSSGSSSTSSTRRWGSAIRWSSAPAWARGPRC